MAAKELNYPLLVSSPGKVIVFGEHAVVHGKAALAAAISLRSYLLVDNASDGPDAKITLDFPDIRLKHSWAVNSLPWDQFSKPATSAGRPVAILKLDATNAQAIKPHYEAVSPDLPEATRKVHRAAAFCFLYIFMSHANADFASYTYTLRSTIPIGAGLGSSASISVCISAALLLQTGVVQPPSSTAAAGDTTAILETINDWAFVGEICIHGNPSGVDNTVATYGKAVLFKRTQAGKPPTVTPLHTFPQLPLLIADSKQPRSTAIEVQKVATFRQTQPAIADLLLDAIDKVTEAAHGLMTSTDFDPKSTASIASLGELVRANHGMLVALGVSHPRLERIKQLVDQGSLGWTKLTGAGGGGCAITLLANQDNSNTLNKLKTDLEAEGCAQYQTLLGAKGLAVMLDANHVSRDVFQKTAEVESLVGTSSADATHNWHHWEQ